MPEVEFLALSIQGFKSFKADSVLKFPRSEGFYFLSGVNRLNPELGPNGVGKSSVWDALTWLLYEKTARNLKAGNIANWEQQDLCSVFAAARIDGVHYEITRTWNPNTLFASKNGQDPKKLTNAELIDLIGIDYEGWLNCVVLGQFNKLFFDLSPGDKLSQFTRALKLDVWLDAADAAKKKATAFDEAIVAAKQKVASAKGSVKVLKQELASAERESKLRDWKKERSSLETRKKETKAKTREIESKIAKQRSLLNKWEGRTRVLEKKLIKASKVNTKLIEEKSNIAGQMYACEKDLAGFVVRIKKLEKLKGNCPVCGQVVTKDSQKTTIARIRTESEWVAMEQDKLRQKLELQKSLLAKNEKRSEILDKKLNNVQADQRKAESSLQSYYRDLSDCKSALVALDQSMRGVKEKQKSDALRIEKLSRKLKKYRGIIKESRELAGHSKVALIEARFWQDAFKDVRLWVVDSALLELEVEVNNALAQLGLSEWKVRFEVEKENKSGGITRGFVVHVMSPQTESFVPWESWSGGEAQRLRIAGQLGLASLIRNRTGFASNLEVWDEPTTHLTSEGINDLLQFFEMRATMLKRQIWLVDHHSLSFGGFTDQYLVVKSASGSRITKQEVRDPSVKRVNKD